MTALFATDNGTEFAHLIQDVLVPHLGLHDRNACRFHRFREAEIAHDRRNDRIVAQKTTLLQIERTNGLDHIAIDLVAKLVNEHDAIRIAIMRVPICAPVSPTAPSPVQDGSNHIRR